MPRATPTGRPVAASLAIVVQKMGKASETFIDAHIARLAPDATILVNLEDMLKAVDAGRPRWLAKLNRRLRKRMARLGLVTADQRLIANRRRDQAVRRLLEAHGVRKVLAEYGFNGWAVADACAAAGAELYVHFHGFDATQLTTSPFCRANYRDLAGKATAFIAPSRYIAGRLAELGFPADRLHVVPCGVDPALFTAWPAREAASPPRIIAVGRLVEKKAPDLLILAFASAAHPEAILEIIGDGPLLERCAALVEALGLEGRVILHGARPHGFVIERFQAASLFAQHSITASNGDMEGLPVSVMEAMMAGLPVVATRHSGIPEAVIEGETGFLVEERDIAGMGQAIARLLAEPELARRLGETSRARALALFDQTRTLAALRQLMGLGEPAGDVRSAAVIVEAAADEAIERADGPADPGNPLHRSLA